jgi:nucleoside-diphosphate-sugar epimerase
VPGGSRDTLGMRVLYVGGTGEISHACVAESLRLGHDVSVFNRAQTDRPLSPGVRQIRGDIEDDAGYHALGRERFDVVCQFLAFEHALIERDLEVFGGRTSQYVFISSASAYSKPLDRFSVITEATPLANPYWEYSQKKAAMEAALLSWHREGRLPVTIVRPSHTYRYNFPVALGGGDWTAERMLAGQPVIVHGDGTSLWTLTHSTDFARPFTRLLGNPRALGEAFHITGQGVHTWDEILGAMATALGAPARLLHVASDTLVGYEPSWKGPLHGDKAPSTLFDNSKVASVAGPFETAVSLEEGFAGIVEHFKARRAKRGPVEDRDLETLVARIVADQERRTA